MGNNNQPQQPFTILNDGQIRGLIESGASGREILAYAFIARFHDQNGTCNTNARESAAAMGTTLRAFYNATDRLKRRSFTCSDGTTRPIIKSVSKGHRNSNAVYVDFLYLDSMGRIEEAEKASQTREAKAEKASQIWGESFPNMGRKLPEVGNPQEYKKKEKIFSAEDAAPQATRRDLAANTSTTDTGRQADRADAPAMEPPTLAEWQRLESLLQYGPLSPTDEARRAAGAARYIPAPPRPTPDREGAA